ncbi:YciI family protein [Marinoscillum pacificum]|uniref:YciI family protein n=1 Tax=Marinoscillum pacificum TaxID=392723 RepID=UPI002157211E|nr:YciI family protein [Marinoscillum pacificum]
MHYLVIGRDGADAAERRQEQRPAHLEGVTKLKEDGKILYAVAMIENGKMVGSVMVMNFATEADLEEWKSTEPYIVGNVWDSVEITECAIPPMFVK